MSISEACNILHIDEGDNDDLVSALLEAIPNFIETATGLPIAEHDDEPLVKTVTGFLLTSWYYADHADDVALNRTIDSIFKCITVRHRS